MPYPRKAGRHLGVEDVRDPRLPGAPRNPYVLPPGVDDDLDRGIGQHPGEGRWVEFVLDRVEHLGAYRVRRPGVGHRHLSEAEQRLVTALGYELGVDGEPSSAAAHSARSVITATAR